jgi:hypothetical protein
VAAECGNAFRCTPAVSDAIVAFKRFHEHGRIIAATFPARHKPKDRKDARTHHLAFVAAQKQTDVVGWIGTGLALAGLRG